MKTTSLAVGRDTEREAGASPDPLDLIDRPDAVRLRGLVSRLASWPAVVASGLCLAVFAGFLFASSAPFALPHVEEVCGATPLDVRPYSTADDVNRFLADCGEEGRAAYRNLQIADLFYPAVVALFMTSALALTLKRLFPNRPELIGFAVVGLIGSGFDYLENVFAWQALAAYPVTGATAGLLGLASMAKTVTSWAAGLLLLVGLALLVVRAMRRRWRSAGPGRAASSLG